MTPVPVPHFPTCQSNCFPILTCEASPSLEASHSFSSPWSGPPGRFSLPLTPHPRCGGLQSCQTGSRTQENLRGKAAWCWGVNKCELRSDPHVSFQLWPQANHFSQYQLPQCLARATREPCCCSSCARVLCPAALCCHHGKAFRGSACMSPLEPVA